MLDQTPSCVAIGKGSCYARLPYPAVTGESYGVSSVCLILYNSYLISLLTNITETKDGSVHFSSTNNSASGGYNNTNNSNIYELVHCV